MSISVLYTVSSVQITTSRLFIDSILKHADVSLGDLPEFIDRLKAISKLFDLNFVVSVSAEKKR